MRMDNRQLLLAVDASSQPCFYQGYLDASTPWSKEKRLLLTKNNLEDLMNYIKDMAHSNGYSVGDVTIVFDVNAAYRENLQKFFDEGGVRYLMVPAEVHQKYAEVNQTYDEPLTPKDLARLFFTGANLEYEPWDSPLWDVRLTRHHYNSQKEALEDCVKWYKRDVRRIFPDVYGALDEKELFDPVTISYLLLCSKEDAANVQNLQHFAGHLSKRLHEDEAKVLDKITRLQKLVGKRPAQEDTSLKLRLFENNVESLIDKTERVGELREQLEKAAVDAGLTLEQALAADWTDHLSI